MKTGGVSGGLHSIAPKPDVISHHQSYLHNEVQGMSPIHHKYTSKLTLMFTPA